MNNTKNISRELDLDELKELSIVGGEDGATGPQPRSIKTTIITLTIITISITFIFSAGEVCKDS